MKTVRFTSLLLILVLVSAAVSAYAGDCPAGRSSGMCCNRDDHCAAETVMDHAVLDRAELSDIKASVTVCPMVLAEMWRERPMDKGGSDTPGYASVGTVDLHVTLSIQKISAPIGPPFPIPVFTRTTILLC